MAGFANDIVFANNGDFSVAGSNKGSSLNGLLTNGQMWIGSTATNVGGTHINVGTLTSPDSSITFGFSSPNITAQVTTGAAVLKTLTGNLGGAIAPVSGNINLLTANSTFVFAGTAGTLTLDFSKNNAAIGTSLPSIAGGVSNTIYGNQTPGNALTGGNENCLFGHAVGSALTNASNNVFIGSTIANSSTLTSQNISIGSGTLAGYGTGSSSDGNIAIGYNSLGNLVSGTRNLVIGYNVGNNYNGSESSNILIGNAGLITENNIIRIGTSGSGQQQQNKTFIAAITGTTVTASSPVAVDTNGQLSDLGFGTATQVLTSNGAGVSPTWQAAGGGGASTTFFAYANSSIVNPTGDGTPYTVVFDSTLNNTGSAYSTGTGLFTAPATGMYHFDTSIAFNAIQATSTTVVIQFNGSAVSVRALQFQGATTALVEGLLCYSGGVTIPMTAGDTMSVLVNVGGLAKNVSLFGSGVPAGASTVFSGYRVS